MPLPCFRRHNSIFDAHGEKGTRVCAREGGSAPGGEGNQLRVGLMERRGVCCCCCRSYGWKAGVREGRQGGGHAVFPMEMGSRCGQLISLSLRDAATHPIVADGHAGNLCGGGGGALGYLPQAEQGTRRDQRGCVGPPRPAAAWTRRAAERAAEIPPLRTRGLSHTTKRYYISILYLY